MSLSTPATPNALYPSYWTTLNANQFPFQGDISGWFVRGRNPDVDTGTVPETLWAQGGLYVFNSAETPLYFSSSDAAESATSFFGYYLNEALQMKTFSGTPNGQTQVQATDNNGDPVTDFFRMIRAFALPTSSGNCYFASALGVTAGVPNNTDDIKALIDVGAVSNLGIFTVPANYRAKIISSWGSSTRNSAQNSADVEIRVSSGGGSVSQNLEAFNFGIDESAAPQVWPLPYDMNEGIDMDLQCSFVNANNARVSFTCGLLLIPK